VQSGKIGSMSFNNCYKGKKVLITGHTGFKGSWLAIWLVDLGAEVYGYALEPASQLDNFVSCKLETKINHKIGDIRDLSSLKEYFDEVQPDIAFHMAAQPLVLLSYKDPVNTFETNLMGVVNFFESVRNTSSVRAAVNVTSDKCYDNREWVWGYRENDPMGGEDPYSASKGCAELITHSYLKSFFQNSPCKIASARAGNVIGGGDWAEDRIIPDFFRSIKSGVELFVRNPNATRPWQHVLEPLSGYLNLGQKLLEDGETFSGGWNFGPNDSANYSVGHLIDAMIQNYGAGMFSSPELKDKPHEAYLLKLDISKAVNRLDWKPALTFEETVEFTVDGYKSDITNGYLYNDRINQIRLFTEKAAAKEIKWVK
jgi:CDP-glucose 4,6-dehydratase